MTNQNPNTKTTQISSSLVVQSETPRANKLDKTFGSFEQFIAEYEQFEKELTAAQLELTQQSATYVEQMREINSQLTAANQACSEALDEITEWKEATGLEVGGDPGGVEPKHLVELIHEMDAKLQAANQALAESQKREAGLREALEEIRGLVYPHNNSLSSAVWSRCNKALTAPTPSAQNFRCEYCGGLNYAPQQKENQP